MIMLPLQQLLQESFRGTPNVQETFVKNLWFFYDVISHCTNQKTTYDATSYKIDVATILKILLWKEMQGM